MPIRAEAGRYGPRLDLDDYERRLISLHAAVPAKLSKLEQQRLDRAELDLRIDYRLGIEFPADRRDTLWRAQRRVRGRWVWLAVQAVATRIWPGSSALRAFDPRSIPKEFAKVLDEEDLAAFLGHGPNRRATS
jgi:hypothetical protein